MLGINNVRDETTAFILRGQCSREQCLLGDYSCMILILTQRQKHGAVEVTALSHRHSHSVAADKSPNAR